ncbi:hypothetical protein Pfo_026613 [Paulownia fortunei]|nr:hypothetical protein Pfo_026613 [Paulownia fortunei]
MSKNYDNWEKLVGAVLRKEQLKQIALSHSRDPSSISDESSSFASSSSSLFHHQLLVYKGQSTRSLAPDFDAMNVDSIWDRFFPSDYGKIKSRLVPGKYVFLPVEAREFTISSGDFPERQFGYSTYGFTEVVEVNSVWSLDIRGKIKTLLLSPKAIYGAYLVFMLAEKFKGLESAKAMVRFVEDETDGEAEMRADIVHLQPVDERKGEMAVRREDGWMEVQIGNFYIDQGDDEEVEVRLMEASRWKTGLFVEGIEFRPLVCVKDV